MPYYDNIQDILTRKVQQILDLDKSAVAIWKKLDIQWVISKYWEKDGEELDLLFLVQT